MLFLPAVVTSVCAFGVFWATKMNLGKASCTMLIAIYAAYLSYMSYMLSSDAV